MPVTDGAKVKEVSKATAIAVCVSIILVLGGLVWWKTSPRGNARAYSDHVATMEQSEALNRAVQREEWLNKNPDAARAHRERYGDKEPQPEQTN